MIEKLFKEHIMGKPLPSKKEFQIMSELIADAEKYDNKEEPELSNESLQSLIGYVEKYIKSNHPEK